MSGLASSSQMSLLSFMLTRCFRTLMGTSCPVYKTQKATCQPLNDLLMRSCPPSVSIMMQDAMLKLESDMQLYRFHMKSASVNVIDRACTIVPTAN